MSQRQVTLILVGKAHHVFTTLRACKGIMGSFYRKDANAGQGQPYLRHAKKLMELEKSG